MLRLAYSFGCLLIRLPEALADEVRAFALSIPPEFLQTGVEGESGIEGDVHVTLKYGLHTADPAEAAAVLCGVTPFWITLGRVTPFHNSKAIVLKVSVRSPELFRLNKFVSNNLAHSDTHFDYRPHVTVAYLKPNEKDPYYYQHFAGDVFDGAEFLADTIWFSTPEGVKTPIPLNGRRAKIASRI